MLMMKMIAEFMYNVWRCLNQIESELHERNMVSTQCVPIKSLSSISVACSVGVSELSSVKSLLYLTLRAYTPQL